MSHDADVILKLGGWHVNLNVDILLVGIGAQVDAGMVHPIHARSLEALALPTQLFFGFLFILVWFFAHFSPSISKPEFYISRYIMKSFASLFPNPSDVHSSASPVHNSIQDLSNQIASSMSSSMSENTLYKRRNVSSSSFL